MSFSLSRRAFVSAVKQLQTFSAPSAVRHVQLRTAVDFVFHEKRSNTKVKVTGNDGQTLLDVAMANNIDIEGACGGVMACSTCHVILNQDLYDKLPAKSEEEQDMLDLAWGLTDTSRLCCQIKVSPEIAGQEFVVPSETNNMM